MSQQSVRQAAATLTVRRPGGPAQRGADRERRLEGLGLLCWYLGNELVAYGRKPADRRHRGVHECLTGGCTWIHHSANRDIECDFETSCAALNAL
jgi:hypothetical protein